MRLFGALFSLMAVMLAANQAVQADLSRYEAMRLCSLRTGLKDGDIMNANTRNQNCAVDCVTRQGTLMTAYAEEGRSCNDQDGYKCVMGICRAENNKISDEFKQMDLYSTALYIKSALVADRDPYPGQGESDPFVVVEVASGGQPSYNGSEVVCYTHVVQDSKSPKWSFACRPLPLRSSTKLRFVVMDSDKPDTQPQLLGHTTQTLENIMNTGSQTLILEQPKQVSGGPYWLEVEVKSKKFTPGE